MRTAVVDDPRQDLRVHQSAVEERIVCGVGIGHIQVRRFVRVGSGEVHRN